MTHMWHLIRSTSPAGADMHSLGVVSRKPSMYSRERSGISIRHSRVRSQLCVSILQRRSWLSVSPTKHVRRLTRLAI